VPTAARNVSERACNFPIRDRSAQYIGVNLTPYIVSLVVVGLRLIFKAFYTRDKLAADDWIIGISIPAAIVAAVLTNVVWTANGAGSDVWTVDFDRFIAFLRWLFIYEFIFLFQVTIFKLSLLAFYLRIFPHKTVRRVIWGTIAFNLAYFVTFFFVTIFQCTPINHFWKQFDGQPGHCGSSGPFTQAQTGLSIAINVWLLIIPLSQLHHLRLSWQKKVLVALMFAVGTA